MANLFRRKPLSLIVSEAQEEGRATPGAFAGAGFSHGARRGRGHRRGHLCDGRIGRAYAGPGLMLSFVLCGLGCTFAGLCYAEFAAMIPLAGSAYTYAYATLGELFAWIIGWDLTLEYAMGASTVSSGWSNYFHGIPEDLRPQDSALAQLRPLDRDRAGKTSPAREFLARTHPELVAGSQGFLDALAGHLLASILPAALARPRASTAQRSASLRRRDWLQSAGLSDCPGHHHDSGNGHQGERQVQRRHRDHQGLGGAVCAGPRLALRASRQLGPRLAQLCPLRSGRNQLRGGYIFFAFIGFDAVSTTAQEAKNPQRDLPIGIIASLFICTVLYVGVAAVLTGMVPWQLINVEAPITRAFLDHNIGWASDIITCGALAGLTSVMLVMLIGQTRVLYAMASDGLLPRKFFAAIHPKLPHAMEEHDSGRAAGGHHRFCHAHRQDRQDGEHRHAAGLCDGLRRGHHSAPHRTRPAAALPHAVFSRAVVPALGILANGYLMYSLGVANWIR
jgi:APA family basic amino acid/polyamine antiporter